MRYKINESVLSLWLRPRAAWLPCVPLMVSVLSACGSHQAPRVLVAEKCHAISASTPFTLDFKAPTAGPFRFLAEPRGLSIISSLASADGDATERARSPVDRFGPVEFVRSARVGESLVLRIEARDSPEIEGSVCVSVAQLSTSDTTQLRAERAFASAGARLQVSDAKGSFDEYLEAARNFDSFDRRRSAQARHAMAELAYGKLGRDDDAYWLSRVALSDLGPIANRDSNRGIVSALHSLQARTLLESERYAPDERRQRVFEVLARAQHFAQIDPFGARELPRLDILRGFMEYRAGDSSKANTYFTQAASQCEALKDWECYARALQNSAALAEEARDYTVALNAFASALRVLPPDLDPQLTADIWGNQGRLQGTAGLFQQSEQSHRVSIRLHANIDDCEGARVGLARLGTLLVQVGSIAEGLDQLDRAASLECPSLLAIEKQNFSPGATPVGDACMNLPEPDSLGPSGKLAVFSALLGLRDALHLENRETESRRCLAAARNYASTSRTRLRLANAEGNTLLDDSKASAANAIFQRGLKTADKEGVPPTNENRSLALLGLARAALIEKQPAVARGYASRSLALGSSRGDVAQVVDALQMMARSFSDTPEGDQAVSILRTAASLIDQVPIDDLDAEKRATWLASQHAVFAELTTVFATQKNQDSAWEAFDASERGRARSLRYAVNLASDERKDQPEPSSARYQELMQRIAELAQPVKEGKATTLPISSLQEMAGATDSSAEAANPKQLQQRLAELGATAVEYAVGRDEMFAFVIDGERIHVTRLGSRAAIAAATADLYERARNPESAYTDVQRAAAKLAELVLWPVTAQVVNQRVILIPDDSLHTVPFALLPWSADKDAPLFIERAELSVMPSTLFITHPRAQTAGRVAAPRFELIGDPVFRASDWRRECARAGDDSATEITDSAAVIANTPAAAAAASARANLPRLRGSREEVLAIAQLAQRSSPASKVSTRLGCEATPAALRAAAANSPELLHIATHGYVDAYRPRLSALALTRDSANEGGASTVGLLDILNMRVASRLVVLSACDTSRGRLLPGEGVLGPAQAFLQAGAASVIASYWRIPDERTAPFMEKFYRYLLVDRLSAAAALRRTQLDYAKDRAAHDWAAFTLYGWPDTAL